MRCDGQQEEQAKMKRAKHIKQKTRTVRYPNISRHADILGVTREHLWRVLTGRRESRSLIMRYNSIDSMVG
jgi:N-glycosylase/DNA lyase